MKELKVICRPCLRDLLSISISLSLSLAHAHGDRQVRFDCEPAKEHLQVGVGVVMGVCDSCVRSLNSVACHQASFVAFDVTLQALETEIGVMRSNFPALD